MKLENWKFQKALYVFNIDSLSNHWVVTMLKVLQKTKPWKANRSITPFSINIHRWDEGEKEDYQDIIQFCCKHCNHKTLERERSTKPSPNNVKEKNIRKKEFHCFAKRKYWMGREALNILQLTQRRRGKLSRVDLDIALSRDKVMKEERSSKHSSINMKEKTKIIKRDKLPLLCLLLSAGKEREALKLPQLPQ